MSCNIVSLFAYPSKAAALLFTAIDFEDPPNKGFYPLDLWESSSGLEDVIANACNLGRRKDSLNAEVRFLVPFDPGAETQAENFWNQELKNFYHVYVAKPFSPIQGVAAFSQIASRRRFFPKLSLPIRKRIKDITTQDEIDAIFRFEQWNDIRLELESLDEKPTAATMAFLQAAIFIKQEVLTYRLSLEQIVSADDWANLLV